jgi:LPXTG-site transpeptidase (sortase) family protein
MRASSSSASAAPAGVPAVSTAASTAAGRGRVYAGGAAAGGRFRAVRSRSGGRVVGTGAMAIIAAAGLGLLTAALTLGPPRPPQPVDAQGPMAAVNGMAPAMGPAAPVRLEIPAIDVQAEVMPVGITAQNELEVPSLDKPMVAGWYRMGVTPGERGNAVIVGHVDSEKVGPAVFFNLGKLELGDVIRVSRADGSVATFQVDGVKSFLKSEFPHEIVYGDNGLAALRLVTCGGQYDPKHRNYLSNVVVFASLSG